MDLDSVQRIMQQREKERAVAGYLHKIRQMQGKDRRWYIRVPDPTKADGRKKIIAQTKEELIDKIYEWHTGQLPPPDLPGTLTIENLWPRYLTYITKGSWSVSTRKRNEAIWNRFFADSDIMKRPIDEITISELELWAYETIRENELTREAWKNIAGLIGGIFKRAERDGYINKNPYRLLEIENHNVFQTPEGKNPKSSLFSPQNRK